MTLDLRGAPGGRWNLLGNPFTAAVSWDAAQIQVTAGSETRTLAEAEAAGWIRSFGWLWKDGAYKLLCDPSLLSVAGSVGSLEPGTGCWIRVFQDCQLLIED